MKTQIVQTIATKSDRFKAFPANENMRVLGRNGENCGTKTTIQVRISEHLFLGGTMQANEWKLFLVAAQAKHSFLLGNFEKMRKDFAFSIPYYSTA